MAVAVETICVHVLRRCNLACRHCWSSSSPHVDDQVDRSDLQRFLAELAQLGLRHVSVSGGEPALLKGLGNLVRELQKLNLKTTITTNGTTIPPLSAHLARVRSINREWVTLRVSVDGPEGVHDPIRGEGNYRRALRAMPQLKQYNGWLGVNTVVFPGLSQLLTPLAHELAQLCIDDWAFMTAVPRGTLGLVDVDLAAVSRELLLCEAAARRSGFAGSIQLWDYASHPNAHALVEWDGRVLLPGAAEPEDYIVGHISDMRGHQVVDSIATFAQSLPQTFFHYRPR